LPFTNTCTSFSVIFSCTVIVIIFHWR
jgi:hypothetical protein